VSDNNELSILLIDDEPIVVFDLKYNLLGVRLPLKEHIIFKNTLRKNLYIGIIRTDEDYRLRVINND